MKGNFLNLQYLQQNYTANIRLVSERLNDLPSFKIRNKANIFMFIISIKHCTEGSLCNKNKEKSYILEQKK